MTILGYQANPLLPALPARPFRDVLSRQFEHARCDRQDSQQGVDQLGLPVPLDPRHAHDLTSTDGKGDVFQYPPAGLIFDTEAGDAESDLIGHRGLTGLRGRKLGSDHQLRQLSRVHLVRTHGCNGLPSPHDGDPVGDLEHFVELVGYEDHRDALIGQVANRSEEFRHLLGYQDGRGLVENEDLRPAEQDLDDLDPLPFADREVFGQGLRIERESVGLAQLDDLVLGGTEIDLDAGARLGAEHDVLEHREVVGQHEMLMNHPDAEIDGVLGGTHLELRAVHQDRAFVGLHHPVEDLHQGGLAGPVLAHDRVDLTGADNQFDVAVGDYARVPLGYSVQLNGRCLLHNPPYRSAGSERTRTRRTLAG